MRIDEVISAVKGYCLGISPWTGEPIDEATTRDKVTYGTTEKECTGIVTCIWPTADIVRQAMRCDANLIISHEALFWNHGDHQDVIGGTRAYAEKKALLDEWATASSMALPRRWGGRAAEWGTLSAVVTLRFRRLPVWSWRGYS